MRAMRACVPKACQHFIFTCERANVPKTCHFSSWRANVSKGVPIFQLFFKRKNASIMVNICKFQEYFGNSRKFISRSKEFETKYFDIYLFLPCTSHVSPIFLKKKLRNYFRNKSIRKHNHKKRKETRSK